MRWLLLLLVIAGCKPNIEDCTLIDTSKLIREQVTTFIHMPPSTMIPITNDYHYRIATYRCPDGKQVRLRIAP